MGAWERSLSPSFFVPLRLGLFNHPQNRLLFPEPSRSYLTAVYCEILRLVDVTQLGACRRTVKPFSLLGFQIAQDALLIGNLHAIHRNKKDWKRPDEFYPERFLDERNMLRIPNNLVPFSLGERSGSLIYHFVAIQKECGVALKPVLFVRGARGSGLTTEIH